MEKEEGGRCAAGVVCPLASWRVFLLEYLGILQLSLPEGIKNTLTSAPTPAPHLHKCFLSMLLWEKHPAGGCYGDPGTPWADGSLVSEAERKTGGHSEEEVRVGPLLLRSGSGSWRS